MIGNRFEAFTNGRPPAGIWFLRQSVLMVGVDAFILLG
jgi:hypothetical protein